jgi:hypothetical protein
MWFKYIIFDKNITSMRDYVEIASFYERNQQSSFLLNHLKNNEFDPLTFDQLMTTHSNRARATSSASTYIHPPNLTYSVSVEYIRDCEILVIVEIVKKLDTNATFIQEHVFY